jgi:hypothetical protein
VSEGIRIRFELIVKSGITEVFRLQGRDVPTQTLTLNVADVIDLEQKLERLLGYRFHINMEIGCSFSTLQMEKGGDQREK